MGSVRLKLPIPAHQMAVVTMEPPPWCMSAPFLCFSAKLHGLDPLPFSGVTWFGLYLGLFFIRLLHFQDA